MEELNIQHFDVIDSTNTEAARQIDAAISNLNVNTNLDVTANLNIEFGAGSLKNLHKKIIVADSQTAGKGRLNRSFYSPKLTGVYMSLIWILDEDSSANPNILADEFNPALYTATAAVCVTRAIKSVYGIDTKIKWVNDIYLGEKKICGILTEGKINPKTGKVAAIIVGIGVNIETPKGDFPNDVKNKAGALFPSECTAGETKSGGEQFYGEENKEAPSGKQKSTDDAMRKDELISEIAKNVFQIYGDKSSFPSVMDEYREKSNLIGKTVTVNPVINQAESAYQAEVLDITQNAALKVKLQNGDLCELSSGEVSLHQN